MKKVAVIGVGTIGSAIVGSLQDTFEIVAIDRQRGHVTDVVDADIVILAVRPKSFAALAKQLRPHLGRQLVVSIMAGVAISTLQEALGTERLVRAMPNLGLATGQSLTGWYSDRTVGVSGLQDILDQWGASLRVDREGQLDSFTALVGSGPSYYFNLAYMLEKQALAHGFSAKHARKIATQTFISAASVVTSETDLAGEVRRVASKGGTTEAALEVFAAHRCDEIVRQAVDAAFRRSQELGVLFSGK